MKRLIFLPILFVSAYLQAAELVYTRNGSPESVYDVTHSTVAVSSPTVSTDAAVNGYRAVYIYNLNPTTTIYYYLGTPASAATVTSIGYPIFPYRGVNTGYPREEKIESSGLINYRLAPGSTGSIDVTKKTIRK